MKWITSKSTQFEILEHDGKKLSSFYDPIKEAKTWINSLSKYKLKKQHIVVIGCGSGYQVDQLDRLDLFESIHVICLSTKQKSLIREHQKYSTKVFINGPEDDLDYILKLKSFAICEITTDKFIDPSLFSSLKFKLSERSEVTNKDFELVKQPNSNELISVKHLYYSKKPVIHKIIQELVK